jgi:hypothetical protein
MQKMRKMQKMRMKRELGAFSAFPAFSAPREAIASGDCRWRPPGSWKAALPFIEDGQEQDQLVCAMELQAEKIARLESRNRQLRSAKKAVASGETASSTVSTLVQLMADTSLTMRRRISAAQLLLGFKSPLDVAQHTKEFLHSVFSDQEMDISHRLEAAELLRKAEDVQLRPSVARPTVAVVYDTPQQIAERSARRRQHIEMQAIKNAEEMAREREQMAARAQRTSGRGWLERD